MPGDFDGSADSRADAQHRHPAVQTAGYFSALNKAGSHVPDCGTNIPYVGSDINAIFVLTKSALGAMNRLSRKSSKNDRDPRHDLSNDFVQALAADWKEHGAATIEAVRQKTPDRYCELIAKVVPKEMLISADRRAVDFSDCPDMQEIGRRLLLQTGIHEVAITDTMIAQTVEANGNFVDRLLLIAKGN